MVADPAEATKPRARRPAPSAAADRDALPSGAAAGAPADREPRGDTLDADAQAPTAPQTGARTARTVAGGTTLLAAVPVAAALIALPVMAVAGLAQQQGWWTPWAAGPAVVAGLALALALLPRLALPRLPWRTALGLLALCAAFGVWVALTHGEHVVVRRDPGAYATYALALARFGGVPLDPGLDVFGLTAGDPAVRVGAAANYAVLGPPGPDGTSTQLVSPQFLVGVPALLSVGWWVGGWSGLMLLPAVAGGLALAAFAALAAHLLGRLPAFLAVVTLGLAQPVVLVARQTFSEPFSLLYVLTGALLLVLATTAPRPRLLALVAGLLLGANLLVRIDAVRELVLLVPLAAVLVGRRHPAGVPLLVGAALSGVPAALATTWWSSPYIASVTSSLGPLVTAGAVLAVVSGLGVLLGTWLAERWARTGVPAAARSTGAALPWVAAGAVAVAGVVLASRPLWLVDRREPYLPGQDDFVEALQSQQGLPLDGLRTYAEDSVTWLVWWLGPVTVVLALLGAVVLVHRGVRAVLRPGPLPGWLLPVAIGVAVTVVSLYRPAITPDHPWADRRYVTVTYPFVVLAATAVLVHLGRARDGVRGTGQRVLVGLLAAAMVVPTAAMTLPMATTRTEVGQVQAAEDVCTALDEAGPRPALLAVGFSARVQWAPVLRARCGVPLVGLEPPPGDDRTLADLLAAAADAARADGWTPVVLAGDRPSAQLVADATGATLPPVVDLRTTEPERLLEEPPTTTRELPVQAWVAALP